MSRLQEFLNAFAQRSGLRGKLTKRLFAGMLAGFQNTVQDMDILRMEIQEQLTQIQQQHEQRTEQQKVQFQEQIRMLTQTAETEKRALQLRLDAAEQANAGLHEQLLLLQEQLSAEGAMMQNLHMLNENMRGNNAQLEALQSDNALYKVKLNTIERQQRTAAPAAAAPAVSQESDYSAIDYFDFENHFRGSIAHIKEAQRLYLPYFEGKQKVLDIGCGRGEFLSLMQEHGIAAHGVDVYAPYVEHCRMQGLSAECGDGIAYLQAQDSVDGIFVGQVVEHLRTEQIIALCDAAYEKLTAGGCLVIETPNPTSLAIYTGAFYIDPSHQKPVHPLTMRYFLEKAGFTQIEIRYPEQSKPAVELHSEDTDVRKMAEILYGAQDYAVIAVKA